MIVKTYNDSSVITVNCTPNPGQVVRAACNLTMRTELGDFTQDCDEQFLRFLLMAEHTSVLEHAVLTVKITNVSRSFLAQITRHRMASITSASQHYCDYRDMPMVVDESLTEGPAEVYLSDAVYNYVELVDTYGIPKEEARQVLPNAAAVTILWTINARSLVNFLRQRMCKRNVNEMRIFSDKLHAACVLWWPELFSHVGAPCQMTHKKCNQGHLKSKECF